MVNIPPWNLDKLEEKKFLNEKNETKENIDKTLKNKSFKKIIIENFCLDDEDLKNEDINKIFNFFENYSENDEEIKKWILYFWEKVNFEKNILKNKFFEDVNSKERKFFFVEYVLFYKIYWEKKIEKIFDFLRIDVVDLNDHFFYWNIKNFLKKDESEEIIDYFLENFSQIDEKHFEMLDFLDDFRSFIFHFKLKDKIVLNESKTLFENVIKYWENIHMPIPDNFACLRDKNIISNPEIADFLYKWIFNSNYIFILQDLSKFDFTAIYAYLLKYKKKSFTKYLDILNTSYKRDFEFDYELFNELEVLLKWKDYFWIMNFSKKFYIAWKDKKEFENVFKHKNDEIIYKILWKMILLEFEKFYKFWILEFIYLWSESENFDHLIDNVDFWKINNKDFLECCKICLNASFNREIWLKILEKYLLWEFDNLEELKIYDTKKNISWISKNLNEEQIKIWLSKNREEFYISDNNFTTLEEIQKNISDSIYDACWIIKKINCLWFELRDQFEDYLDFEKYFANPLNRDYSKFKNFCASWKSDSEKLEQAKNLFSELLLKIDEIDVLSESEASFKNENRFLINWRKIEKIIIEKELNPLRMLQMWNFVDWSCLSYYNQNWYYYSAISNTIDVNKWVFYLYDENEELIWRVLVTIWNDNKLTRYKMYYKWKVNISLNQYFDEYFRNLAEKMWIEINWLQENVQKIECEEWYEDWEYVVKK